MSLREQFEAWCEKEHPYIYDECDYDSKQYKEALWQAYQTGHKLAVMAKDAHENAIAAQFFDNALSPTRKTPRTPINEIDY